MSTDTPKGRWKFAVVDQDDGGHEVARFDTRERADEEVEWLDERADQYRHAVRPVFVLDADEPPKRRCAWLAILAAGVVLLALTWCALGNCEQFLCCL